ncbi:MAG: hypothetical protein AAFS10_01270 [Myxococcota bacterium]
MNHPTHTSLVLMFALLATTCAAPTDEPPWWLGDDPRIIWDEGETWVELELETDNSNLQTAELLRVIFERPDLTLAAAEEEKWTLSLNNSLPQPCVWSEGRELLFGETEWLEGYTCASPGRCTVRLRLERRATGPLNLDLQVILKGTEGEPPGGTIFALREIDRG